MKIAILGAGNAGCAVAADLVMKDHNVTLIKTSHTLHEDNFRFLEESNGEMTLNEFGNIRTAYINSVTRDLSKAQEAEIIIVFIGSSGIGVEA